MNGTGLKPEHSIYGQNPVMAKNLRNLMNTIIQRFLTTYTVAMKHKGSRRKGL